VCTYLFIVYSYNNVIIVWQKINFTTYKLFNNSMCEYYKQDEPFNIQHTLFLIISAQSCYVHIIIILLYLWPTCTYSTTYHQYYDKIKFKHNRSLSNPSNPRSGFLRVVHDGIEYGKLEASDRMAVINLLCYLLLSQHNINYWSVDFII